MKFQIVTRQKLILCDVCDTMYRSNTTFDFIRFIVRKKGRVHQLLFQLIAHRLSPLFYFLVFLNKVTRMDVTRLMAVRFLSGMSRTELDHQATIFHEEFLASRANQTIFEHLTNPATTVILLSASIDPVIKAIASAHQFNYRSSTLQWENEVATGRLQTDLTGRKHELAKEIISSQAYSSLQVITDNRSDWELVKMADERFAVIADESEKVFWKPLNPQFILVS